MRIGLAYDLKETVGQALSGPEDALEEYDSAETVELIARSLEIQGHGVVMLGGGREFLRRILEEPVDFVFNIAEGRGTYRSREAQVPSILEMLGVPYSGSDPQCLAICLDKPLTKTLVGASGVRTPCFRVVESGSQLGAIPWSEFSFPVIIKPAYEGSSKGIRLASLAESPKEAEGLVRELLERYQQPMMVEEFISGEEVTVGVVGNSPPAVVGVMRVVPRQKRDHFVYSLEVKRDWKNLVDYECPAQVGEEVIGEISSLSLRAFETLGCRDCARVDFRVSPEGLPYFIEINPLPGLGIHSDLYIMATAMGWSHSQLVGGILNAALRRYPQCASV
ncbi:MAG: ATP-grasp domain-containing protein [Dehalococcoidales bacterium]|nr:ATP-grasp domain-containing protein [Dehalococcoidales bacterium]